MDAIAMQFDSRKIHCFYRMYILPRHIAKAANGSERHKSLTAELERRQKEVDHNEGQEELDEYVGRQNEKQAAYDAQVDARAAHDQDPTDLTGPALSKATAHLAAVRVAFSAEYH